MSSPPVEEEIQDDPEAGNLLIDIPETLESTQSQEEVEEESNTEDTAEMILPDDVGENFEDNTSIQASSETTQDLLIDAKPKIRRRRRKFTSFNNDGSYVSSICESVKLRQRRKSIYFDDTDDWMKRKNPKEQSEESKEDVPKKKIRRRKSIGMPAEFTKKEETAVPAKITSRRRTMYANEFMSQKREEVKEEFPKLQFHTTEEPLRKSPEDNRDVNEDEQSQQSDVMYCLNDDLPTEFQQTLSPPVHAAGSSRRKSTLKPMAVDVKFEKIVSYRNPTIPFQNKYKSCISILNKVPNSNDQLMRRLACLKVFHQYFYSEINRSARLGKALKKALNN